MKKYAWIAGWGKYVPERVLTNEDLSRIVDTTDEWIRRMTGIEERRIAGPKDTTSSMAIEAARQALEMADVTPSQVDLIIVSTVTADYPFPATANLVQAGLGCDRAGAFDLAAGCSGFVYGLGVAAGMIGSGAYKNILVIGAETLSRLVDWNDRATCVLFGDGAGAFLLQANDEPGGVLSWKLGSDGSGADLLMVPAGGTCQPTTVNNLAEGLNFIKMNGREVFRFATRIMGQASREVLEMAGMNVSDVDLFIPHQANLRIINAAARYLEIPDEKVFVNVNRYGNTSSASIPIAFCEAMETLHLKPGDTIVLVGFG
ncbi:MAG: ketoacyl-ACP synthase III, partial [Chloroflexi bacterium]|nr:ketoacyl-ACP synthase III [Chloroflexota bacterium]